MKKLFLITVSLIIALSSLAQFSDTTELNHFIRDSIKDRRPEKITAKQIQTVMSGLSKFLGVSDAHLKGVVHDSIARLKTNLDSSKGNLRNEIAGLGQPYNVISFLLSYNGSAFTSTVLHSDFGATTFSFTNPLNDLITVAASSAVFTATKTAMQPASLAAGNPNVGTGNMYFIIGKEFTTSSFTVRIPRFDMDETSLPQFEKMFFEIRVYN